MQYKLLNFVAMFIKLEDVPFTFFLGEKNEYQIFFTVENPWAEHLTLGQVSGAHPNLNLNALRRSQ